MIYLTGVSNDGTRAAADTLGLLCTPLNGYTRQIPTYHAWAADNGCFSKGDSFDGEAWLTWLSAQVTHLATCKFAVLPDVVGDAEKTATRSLPWVDKVRSLGFPAAFVLQNGVEEVGVPWDDCDAVFVGGDDDFKLGSVARAHVEEARERGKWTHMGRVNSLKRMRLAAAWGCDSVDGTYLRFGKKADRAANTQRLLRWCEEVAA